MNRILKFRAWDSMNNKWLLGYEYPNLGGFSMMGEVMAFGEYQQMLSSFKLEDWDKITLMQYTGLSDKNGKEIYEGDIVAYTNPSIRIDYKHLIKWDANFACFALYDSIESQYARESDWVKITEVEIIGNIYENPELLIK